MTDPGLRFCSRCGTALVAGMPFCPKCGFNSAEAGDRPAVPMSPGYPPVDALGRSLDAAPSTTTRPEAPRPEAPKAAGPRSTIPTPLAAVRQFVDRASRGSTIVFGALIITAGLVVFGLLMRPQASRSPASLPTDGSTAGPSAPIVGMTIQSPLGGQAVATKEVTVIGLAPPGLTITRDVSLGLDQHATADGTGHWAINVGLNDGENELVFRIGDDRSTEQRLKVVYTPPQAP